MFAQKSGLRLVGLPLGPPFFMFFRTSTRLRFAGTMLDLVNNTEQLRKIEEIVRPVCRVHGMDLVDARFHLHRGPVLKVIIERAGASETRQSGVSIADCQAVSQDLSTAMDAYEEIGLSGEYRLEVSSPGLDRPLFRLDDFRRFEGNEIKLQTGEPVQGRKRFRGTLLGVEGDHIRLRTDDSEVVIPHRDIAKANIVYRFEDETGVPDKARHSKG
jgi:ribosome maturation factor RimP